MVGREHLPKALLGLPCCGGLIEHRPGCTRRTNNVEPDPRDAEIARLRAALAAGPAALRAANRNDTYADADSPDFWPREKVTEALVAAFHEVANQVEQAQRRAMEEG